MQGICDLNKLSSVSYLNQGQCLVSNSRNYYAIMQPDGNFVLYVSAHFSSKNAIWSSDTSGTGRPPFMLKMQQDGNLVLYDAKEKATWSSGTWKKGTGPFQLIMQDDGNLVLYDSKEKATWSSGTSRH